MCDVIKNVAGGKEFLYCKIHKVEAQDCPSKMTPAAQRTQNQLQCTHTANICFYVTSDIMGNIIQHKYCGDCKESLLP